MYLPEESIIYDDIFSAMSSGYISKSGSPNYWDDSSYRSSTWNGKMMILIGGYTEYRYNGLLINSPSGYNVLWVRIMNDEYVTFRLG